MSDDNKQTPEDDSIVDAEDSSAASNGSAEASGETMSFQAEVSRLLQLMVHSVYSNKEIFLRELISNAADACEKLRYAAITDPALTAGDASFGVSIETNKEAGTLIIADNGIGMNRQELIDNLGTIARSGTKAFLDNLSEAKDGSALIGQFGVGFYSSFMVAETVAVTSRKAGDSEAWTWTSNGEGAFTIVEADAENAPARGTRILINLKDDEKSFAEASELERIIKAYSAHIPIPVSVRDHDAEEAKSVTDGSALWVKSKNDISAEEYKDFYGHVSGQFDEPALNLHYRAEGRYEYSVLLFVPSMKPFDLFDPDRKGRVKLYVRRVFITDEAEILPAWLRFVRGVIDSEDLPLNLSREMLQANPVLEAIKKGVTSRVLSELEKVADKDPETFAKIWDAFGAVLKEGLYEDPARRDALLKISRFKTTKSGDGLRSLASYIEDLKENQDKIYFALGENPEAVLSSPHLEGFRARDVEVLLLSDSVDTFWVQTALGYEGKAFQSITQGGADLEKIAAKDDDDDKESDEDAAARTADLAVLTAFFKETLGEKVQEVRESQRLAESPVCLVAPEFGPDRQMEKIMGRAGRDMGAMAPVLEVNPKHALIAGLAKSYGSATDKARFQDAAWLLLGQARILDGELPDDPADYSKRISAMLASSLN